MKRVRSRKMPACMLILLLGIVQIASGVQRPANDDCANATAVSDVTDLQFNTATATFDGPGHYITTPNIWYCYTATCTGGATVSLAGSSFDTKLAVYDGCACDPSGGDLIKSNDDFHGQQSEVTFQVTNGKQYLIEIGGYNSSSKGPGVMTISCSGQSCQPANDGCTKAEIIGNVVDQPFDTTCATVDGPGDCMSSPNIWYRYTAVGTGDVTVSLAGSLFDTKLAIYAGTGCYPQSGAMIECNDDFGNSLASQITFQGTAGEEYLIEVGGYNADEVGAGVITISSQGKPPVGSKDDCEFAQPIGDVDNVPFDTTDSSFDGPGLCMSSPNIWYCYTASCTGDVRGAKRALHQLLALDPPPSAAFCYNDMTAIGLLHAARAHNLQVPGDLALVGFDDIPFASYVQPPLTTIAQPKPEMGRQAVEMVLALLAGGANGLDAVSDIVVQGELIVRGSSRGEVT